MHKPRLSMYWFKDTLILTSVFGQLISRDRFLFLLRFLHCAANINYNLQDSDCDKLYKAREVANVMKTQGGEVYYPGKKLSVGSSFQGEAKFQTVYKN